MATAALKNRVLERTTTVGAGAVTLGGVTDIRFRTFLAAFGAAAVTFYCIIHEELAEWEIGVGTVNGDGTLTRSTVIASTNANALVNFSAGTKEVFHDVPAEKLVALDRDSSQLTLPGALSVAGAAALQLGFTASASSTVNAGSDADTDLTVGSPGTTPTAGRSARLNLVAPSSGGFFGAAYTQIKRAASLIWAVGIFASASGAMAANTDYAFDPGTGTPVVAITAAGQVRASNGYFASAGGLNVTGASTITGTLGGITTLTATTLAGTLSTVSQPNVTTMAGLTSAAALATIGTVTVGVWNATPVVTTYGGTGLNAWTAGDVPYYSAGTTLSKLAIGANTNVVLGQSGGFPSWLSQPTLSVGTDNSTTLTLGTGGAGPTATRTAMLLLNAPSSGGNPGAAWVQYQLAGAAKWFCGVGSGISGVRAAVDDWSLYNNAAYVMSVTQAGQVRSAVGFYSTATASGTLTLGSATSGTDLVQIGGGQATFRWDQNATTIWTFKNADATNTNSRGQINIQGGVNVLRLMQQAVGGDAYVGPTTAGGLYLTSGAGTAAVYIDATQHMIVGTDPGNNPAGQSLLLRVGGGGHFAINSGSTISIQSAGPQIYVAGGGNSLSVQYTASTASGTVVAPVATGNSTGLAQWASGGYDGAAWAQSAKLYFGSTQLWAVGAHGTSAQMYVVANGATGITQAQSWQQDGTSYFGTSDPGGPDLLRAGGNATFSVGTDNNTTLTVGKGGGAPTAQRSVWLLINAPSNGGNVGDAYIEFDRASAAKWTTGVFQSVSGMQSANDDYVFGAATRVASITQAGQLRSANGLFTPQTVLIDSTGATGGTILRVGTATNIFSSAEYAAFNAPASQFALALRSAAATFASLVIGNSASGVTELVKFMDNTSTARAYIKMDQAVSDLEFFANFGMKFYANSTPVLAHTITSTGLHIFGATDPGGSDLIRASGNATLSVGTDNNTTLTVGTGGGAPTGSRTAALYLNTPDDNSANFGQASVRMARNGTEVWRIGFDRSVSSSGPIVNRGDFFWQTAGAGFAAALTASGQFRALSGYVTKGGAAGSFGTVDNFSVNIIGNNATVATFSTAGILNLITGGVFQINATQVVSARDTGWTAMTGASNKATAYDTATVTLAQLAGRVMALQAALTTHGLIGA